MSTATTPTHSRRLLRELYAHGKLPADAPGLIKILYNSGPLVYAPEDHPEVLHVIHGSVDLDYNTACLMTSGGRALILKHFEGLAKFLALVGVKPVHDALRVLSIFSPGPNLVEFFDFLVANDVDEQVIHSRVSLAKKSYSFIQFFFVSIQRTVFVNPFMMDDVGRIIMRLAYSKPHGRVTSDMQFYYAKLKDSMDDDLADEPFSV